VPTFLTTPTPLSGGQSFGPIVSGRCDFRGQAIYGPQDITMKVPALWDPGDGFNNSITVVTRRNGQLSTIHSTYRYYSQNSSNKRK
jgi:hypothetical protein